MKRIIKNIMVMFFIITILISCATSQQQRKAIEGEFLETGKTRSEVMDAVINILIEESYTVDTINEKYGIISCKPYQILTGQLMTKLDEPGGGFVGTNSHLIHVINFTATVSETGGLKIRAIASTVTDENIFTMMANPQTSRRSEQIDTFRTLKLNEYFIKKIKERLHIQN